MKKGSAEKKFRKSKVLSLGWVTWFFLSFWLAVPAQQNPPVEPDQVINTASVLVSEGKLAEAEAMLRTHLATVPGDKDSRILLGIALERQNRFTEAEGIYTDILQKDPEDIFALSNLAILQARTDRLPEAIQNLEKILQIKPDHNSTVFNLASLYSARDENSRAIGLLEKTVGITPVNPTPQTNDTVLLIPLLKAYLAGDMETEANRLATFLEEKNPDDLNLFVKIAVAFANTGRFERPAELFEKINSIMPGNFEILYNLGLVYLNLGNIKKSEEVFQQAAGIKPENPEIHYQLGKLAQLQNQSEKALSFWLKALELKPIFPEVNFSLGRFYSEKFQFGRALPFYERAAAQNEGSLLYKFELGITFIHLKRFEDVRAILARELPGQPENLNLLYLRGFLARAEGDYEKAIADFEKLRTIAPDNDEVLAQLGILAYNRGENTRSEDLLRRALLLNPKGHLAQTGLGMLLIRLKKYDEAITLLENGAAQHKDNADIFYQLFLAYLRSDQKEKSDTAFREYKRLEQLQNETN